MAAVRSNVKTLVESLKRLYKKGKITEEWVQLKVEAGTLTQDECNYILED